MIRILQITAILILTLMTLPAPASTLRHGSCVVDTEIMELPACALETKNGQDYVVRRYVGLFDFSGTPPFAYSIAAKLGWFYFNREGRVVVKDVAPMDNGPSAFHYGLVRVTVDDKWGLANAEGTLVVPLQYDGILDFSKLHGWDACTGCRSMTEEEHSWFQGGKWVSLDYLGHVMSPGSKSKPIP